MERIDRDHIFWTEPHWRSTKEAAALRSTPSLIIPLYRDVHEEKHKNTPPVPLLGFHTLRRTLQIYEPGSTPIQSLDNVMLAIEQAANNPNAHIIEKHMAELAIWALDLQHPFIAESPRQPGATVIDINSRANAAII